MRSDVFKAHGGKENNLNAIRWALAASVIFSHCLGDALKPFYQAIGIANIGSVAVGFFFAISGYVITQSRAGCKSVEDYAWRRARRILPGLVVAALACAVIGALMFWNWPVFEARMATLGPRAVLWDLFGQHSPSGHSVLDGVQLGRMRNYPLWTINHEMLCYAGVGVAWATGLLRRPWVAVILLIGAYYLYLRLPSDWAWSGWRLYTWFLAGVVIYQFRDLLKFSNVGAVICGLCLATLGGCHNIQPFLILPGSYLLFWAGYHPAIRLSAFGSRTDLSYGTYLYGAPAQFLLNGFLGGWALAFTALAVATLGALASWRLVERPAMKWKQPSFRWPRLRTTPTTQDLVSTPEPSQCPSS